MTFEDGFFDTLKPAIEKAYTAMDALEKGAIANPDEDRMVLSCMRARIVDRQSLAVLWSLRVP